jgi:hypothetical protein
MTRRYGSGQISGHHQIRIQHEQADFAWSVPLIPAAELGPDLLDGFLLDGLLRGWTPRMFFDDPRKLNTLQKNDS